MVGKLAKATFALNRSAIDWWFVARSSIGVAVCLIAGLALASPLAALAAGMGAISVGFTSLRGVYRTRAAAMLGTAFGMGATGFLAAVAGHSTVAIVLVTAATAYAYGIFSSLGESASAIGLNSMITVIILSNLALSGAQLWIVPLCVLAGGLVQTLLVVAFWPVARHGAERRALAQAYRDLAAYARSLDGERASYPPHGALVGVRAALADPQPFGRRGALVGLQTLADEAERIRASLASLATIDERRAESLSEEAAEILDEIAGALERARPLRETPAWQRARGRLEEHPQWEPLFGQLRAAWRSAALPAPLEAPSTVTADQSLLPHVDAWRPVLRANARLDSPFGRHAARLAIVLGVAMLLYRVTHLERGYWIALTALFVLRPDFSATFARGFARIGGTLAGAGLAAAIGAMLPRAAPVEVTAAIAFAALGYLTFSMNYALYTVTITAYVIFMFSLVGIPETGAIVERIGATLGGGLLAMAAYAAWPTWEAPLTRQQLADLLEILREYAVAMLRAYAGTAAIDRARIDALQTAAWSARTNIDASIERLLSEPESTHDMAPQDALTIVASTQRFGLANLALSSGLRSASRKPIPALQAFSETLDSAMREIVAALRAGRAPTGVSGLREAYVALSRALPEPKDRVAQLVLAQCDLFVDSLNTIAGTLR